MIDREKVIKGFTFCSEHGSLNGEDCHGHYEYTDNLKDIIKVNDYSKQCPYNGCKTGCVKTLVKDALALLKEQKEREKRICKEICAIIRGSCSTDTDNDKEFVCHEIQKRFTEGQ